MITGKFHSHLTISPTTNEEAERAARLVHGKITFIDLGTTDHPQTDYMITNHYVTGYKGLTNSQDVTRSLFDNSEVLDREGFKVLRVKLEHEIEDPRTPPECVEESRAAGVYLEVHMKLANLPDKTWYELLSRNNDMDSLVSGWALSMNTKTGAAFMTKRFPPSTDYIEIKENIAGLSWLYNPQEIKYEVALVDTNQSLDNWWMGK